MSEVTTKWILDLVDNLSSPMKSVQQTSNSARVAVDSVSDAGSRLNSGFSSLIKKIGLASAAVYGFHKARQFVIEGERSYRDLAESQTKLGQIMRNTMNAADSEIQAINSLTDAQERLGIVSRPVQVAGAQELATYLSQRETLEQLIPVMNDMIAQQLGINATQQGAANIASMLGKVMDGQVGALSRYGYKFDETQERILKYGNEAQRAAVLTEVVTSSIGGVNQALAQTPGGRLQKANMELGAIKDTAGALYISIKEALLPFWSTSVQMIGSVVKVFEDNKEGIITFFEEILSFGLPIFNQVWGVVSQIANVIREMLLPVFQTFTSEAGNISSFIGTIIDIVEILINKIGVVLVPVFQKLWEGIMRIVSAIKNALQPVLNTLSDESSFYYQFLDGLSSLIMGLVDIIIDILVPVLEFLINLFGRIIRGMIDFMETLWNTFKAVQNFLVNLWGATKSVFTNMGAFLGEVLGGIWDLIKMVFNPANWFDPDAKFSDGLNRITVAARKYGQAIADGFNSGKNIPVDLDPDLDPVNNGPDAGFSPGVITATNLLNNKGPDLNAPITEGGTKKTNIQDLNLSDGSGKGSKGKSITMNVTMNNNFNGLKNLDEATEIIVRQINDKLNDALAVQL